MSQGKGFSLWLVPDANQPPYCLLKTLINELSTVYQTPQFIPHVTLLNDVETVESIIREKSAILANRLEGLVIQLGELGSNGIYFQQLFSQVSLSEPLRQARLAAEQLFEVNRPPYFPHSSLAYGHLTTEEVATLEDRVRLGQPDIASLSFPVAALAVWSTNGPIDQWYEVARFPVSQP
ncbi:MAG TPA: hypothetical protein VLE93_00105 [Candidatus Saccharimonadales bacterium]|nr:hypothetical protein [Candidatus Saccharimonadales bacterium]